MLPGRLRRCRPHPAVILAGLLVFTGMGTPIASAAPDLKIKRTSHRFSEDRSIRVGPQFEQETEYIQGDRRRVEDRTQDQGTLWWPGGPVVTFYNQHTAQIRRCDDDKLFELNLDDRTYQVGPFGGLSDKQIQSLSQPAPMPRAEAPTHPTVLHETTTVDTGERKQVFGYSARHVITTSKHVPLDGGAIQPSEGVSDGWYIDMKTRIPCDPNFPSPREGSTYVYAYVQLRSSGAAGEESTSKPELVETKYIGKPETGLCIWGRTTSPSTILRNGVEQVQVIISETQLTELSVNPLDPALFEVPRNFKSVDQIRYGPRISWWSYIRYWGHYYWVRFKQSF